MRMEPEALLGLVLIVLTLVVAAYRHQRPT
jgi:hypothetical protein